MGLAENKNQYQHQHPPSSLKDSCTGKLACTLTALGHQLPAAEAALTHGHSHRSNVPTETRNSGNYVLSWQGKNRVVKA